DSNSTLNQLKATLPSGQLPSSYRVYFKNTLIALCHALEDHILKSTAQQPGQEPLVLVTFQEGKWYMQEADRYLQISQNSAEVAIVACADSGFDTHPTGQLENVSLVELAPDDNLVNEWNLIIVAPGYTAMVLCHELSPEEYQADTQPRNDVERKFYGLWTFDRTAVEAAASILIERMRPYDEALADRLSALRQQMITNPEAVPIDLTSVVSRIVNYLQDSQEHLITANRQAQELWELEGHALRVNRNMTANKLQAFLRMAQRVDERDQDNPLASLQVAALAETLGQILDLPTIRLRRLRLAGLLFRIGLAEAPIEVFQQPASQLRDSELVTWNNRAYLGGQLLAAMSELEPVRVLVSHQLENWDGSGRPDGLRGDNIPLESRILRLAAYFQELTQQRGDRPALSLAAALEKCVQRSGSRFDPALIEHLTTIVRLTEIGMMQLPDRPSQLPKVWLEESLSPVA
ncbi:MAG: HD domain-containing phosphohydrolase, partial [Cyanobacteria bacterium P01_A01_bin.70]